MNIIELIFAFLDSFVTIDERKKLQLRHEANEWWGSITVSPTKSDGTPQSYTLLNKLKSISSLWYVQVALAVLFPFIVKFMSEYLNSVDTIDSTEPDHSDKVRI